MIGAFVPIEASDQMAFMKAMNTLVQIEHFAMAHDVLMSECTQISELPRPQRAVAAGLRMNQIAIEQMEEEARTHTAAIDGGEHNLGRTDAHTTIRGGAPRIPQMTTDGRGAATNDTHGTDAINMAHDKYAALPKLPPPTQRHQGNGTTAIGAGEAGARLGCILLGLWLSKENPQYFTRPPK